jgi:uncharacterized protein YkwD
MEKTKKWLLPNRKNNHHPHILRPIGLGLVLLLVVLSNLSYNYTSAREVRVLGYATSISANEVISLSNQQRASNGLGALTYNSQLAQAAHAKAQDMFAQNYWSHYNPQGQGPAYFISNAGYSYSIAGENLAKDFNTSSGVVNAWMNSTGHRANILHSSYVHTGVAVVNGILQGSETTIVVAMYGAPASQPAPAPTQTQPKSAPPAPAPTPTPSQPAPATQPPAATAPSPTPPANEQPTEQVATDKAQSSAVPVSEENSGQVNAAATEAVLMRENINWAQQSTLVILSTLLLISVLKHTLVWRTNRRGWRHIWFRAHPAAQYALILVAIVSTFASSAGAIL